MREEDLCPGYIVGHVGDFGICSCGLHWKVVMPPHDRNRHVLTWEAYNRIIRRKARVAEERAIREAVNASIEKRNRRLYGVSVLRRMGVLR
jgi:hypothetical protein